MKRYLDVSTALHQAVKKKELTVHYQPVVDHDGQPVGAETLVRWPHPGWGWVAPTEFIPIAEDRGLIVTIGHRVLRQACEQLRHWLDQGLPFQWISVNLSPRQFWEHDLSGHISSLLTETGLDGKHLKLEITEGLLLDHPPQALTTLNELHDLGVRLALDDFGTGYSSLSYLKRYPFDTLKIDRSFVHNLERDHDDHNLTRTIIAMARALGLKTIAEGVETTAGADLLRNEGCDLLQGFLYSKPLPAAELEAWVRVKMSQP
jgi:EAL domain-containing protein (putative c-di-GMP-specific phosphodiesterase class I)